MISRYQIHHQESFGTEQHYFVTVIGWEWSYIWVINFLSWPTRHEKDFAVHVALSLRHRV
jgi:hypothetical protein